MNLGNIFGEIIAIDGKEYKPSDCGNNPISPLAHALKGVGINLEVAEYKDTRPIPHQGIS
ncbi:hypothetical protein F4824DRAFT_450605 [Ustulina deusta]|nr:hypothetical protein F4824DRAFT_450605 [Ustulina deusta]